MNSYVIALCSSVLIVAMASGTAGAQSVMTDQQAEQVLALENLHVSREKVSGVIVNNSPHTIRDARLLIQYHWLWRNEQSPGTDSPGRAVVVQLPEELEPGKPHRFLYTPEFTLPRRNDGFFMPEVDIASFTTVVQPGRAAVFPSERQFLR